MQRTDNTTQVFWAATSSIFSLAFGFITPIIFSRYFTKIDYGTYKQVLYVYSTFLIVFTLGLPKAYSYFLPRVPIDEAKNLINKITKIFYILGGICSVILFLFSPLIASILRNPDLNYALKVFSPVPLLMLPTMGFQGILATYKKTIYLTYYTIITNIISLLCILLPVIIFKGTYIHAIYGFVVSSAFQFILAIRLKYMPVKKARTDKCNISYREIFKFSIPLLYASLWGILIRSADQFFISRYFGTEVFADFSNGSVELPFVGVVVSSCSLVLLPVFSKQIHERLDPQKSILPLWKNVFEQTAKLIYPLVIYSWFFADVIMIVMFGNLYEKSGIYFRIKLAAYLFDLISYAPLILALGKTKQYSKVHFFTAILLILFEYLSILIFNTPYAIAIVSVIFRIFKVLWLLIIISNFFEIRIWKLFPLSLIYKIIFPSIAFLIIIRHFIFSFNNLSGFIQLCFSFILFITLYGIYSYIFKFDYFSIIKPLLKSLKSP